MTAVPDFAPRFIVEPGMRTLYTDGRVHGVVGFSERDGVATITIHEWDSDFKAQGHTEQALRWLRERHPRIVANSVGSIADIDDPDFAGVGDTATYYWEHMRSKGLADVLIDDDGNEIPPGWNTGHKEPSAGPSPR